MTQRTDQEASSARTPIAIGRYEVVAQLATGGMAEILLGRIVGPNGFERPVVIKRILPHLARVPSFIDMFLDEARIVADIRHPNVVQVHELGRDADELFLVMEYLAGESTSTLMRRLVSRSLRLPMSVAAHVVAELCAGLHAAHELTDVGGRLRNLVHRDVSPQNLFITYAGEVKLLDFGIAKAADRITNTEGGQVKGKFEYMAPEQCMSKPLDRRADIFAAGIILYELCTGKRLFRRNNPAATIHAIFADFATPSSVCADVPEALERICLKALAKDRNDRYATAADMRRELLAAIRTIHVEEEPRETLAELMKSSFTQRVIDKEEMLRKLRLGGRNIPIPEHQTDTFDEQVPTEIYPTDVYPTELASEVAPRVSTHPISPAKVWAVAGAAIAAGCLLAFAFHARGTRPAVAAATSESPITSSAPSASGPLLDFPDDSVVVHVESAPAGSHVFLHDQDQGVTPLDLQLARATSPLTIELRSPGFSPQIEHVTPDSNQRILIALSRATAMPAPKPHDTSHAVTAPTSTKKPTDPGFTKFN